ncbi:MAG: hypothetical protein HKN19_16990, partial [Halioglobus sp.]|nr:hypothetical protein [Halioglobus sp.]
MKEWLEYFADPNFMPHGHCYLWRPDILWTHVGSDLVIALAYYAIPVVLGIFLLKQRRAIPFPEIIALFVAFIFLCGTTHLFAIYTTWYPAYEQEGWLKALTALVSITTALVLIPRLPTLVTLPGIQVAYEKSERALAAVQVEKEEMQALYDA